MRSTCVALLVLVAAGLLEGPLTLTLSPGGGEGIV